MTGLKYDILMTRVLENYDAIIDDLDVDDKCKKRIRNLWLESIRLMEYLCKKHVRRDNITTVVLIISSSLVPVLININPELHWLLYVATALSILVAIITGFKQFYKFGDKWKHFRKTAEQLKLEGEMFFALSNAYSVYGSHKEGIKLFTQNICMIKSEQINDYIQKIVKNKDKDDDGVADDVDDDDDSGKE